MWLYVPPTCLACAPASADSNSVSVWRFRTLARSVSWRGKLRPPRAWSRRWKQGGFIRLLSGLTLPPSTLDLGVASFISSLRETPARTTASPESGPEATESGSLPPRSAGSPTSAGLILSSARTCRGTRTDSLRPSSHHWKGWATALRQEFSARPKLATPCGASGYSSWPSARTSDTNGAGEHGDGGLDLRTAASEWKAPVADDTGTRSKRYEQGGMALSMQADCCMAPNVPNGGRTAGHAEKVGNTLYHGDKKVQLGLEHQAKTWPRPATRDYKGSSEDSIIRKDGKSRANMLDFAAEQFFRPPSSRDQTIAAGAMSSTDGPNSNQPSVKRKLNPIFVEALMRWPTGLSGFERQAMAWTLWWHTQHGFALALVSPREEPAQMSLL